MGSSDATELEEVFDGLDRADETEDPAPRASADMDLADAGTEDTLGRDAATTTGERAVSADQSLDDVDPAAVAGVDGDDRPRLTSRGTIRSSPDEDVAAGWAWRVVAGVGVVALVAAVAMIAAPRQFAPSLRTDVVRSLRTVALVLGGTAGLIGLLSAYHRGRGGVETAGQAGVELPVVPESLGGDADAVPGTKLDDAIESIGGRVHGSDDVYTVMKVRSSLRGLAIRVTATTADCSRERASELVENGAWTDDVRAAEFVGGDEVPDLPLGLRIRDWASGRAFERRVEATVDELAERMGVDDA